MRKTGKIGKVVKLVNGKNGRSEGRMIKMLKLSGPKIDANGKMVKPVSAQKW